MIFFYTLFHSALNLLAEVLCFADREFYRLVWLVLMKPMGEMCTLMISCGFYSNFLLPCMKYLSLTLSSILVWVEVFMRFFSVTFFCSLHRKCRRIIIGGVMPCRWKNHVSLDRQDPCYAHIWIYLLFSDFWNAESIQYFWKTWNIPVHRWALRHIFMPMMRNGYSKKVR